MREKGTPRCRHLAACAAAVLLAVLAQQTPAMALDNVNFKIHFAINPAYTYLFVAKEKGYFQDNNLGVNFFTGAGSLPTLTELTQAKWDFTTGDFGDVIQLVSKGAAIKATFFVYQRTPVGYGVSRDSGIASPRDFVGKKYGSQQFNLATKALPLVCKQHAIDCQRIEFVNVDFNVQVQSFLRGDFQILGGFVNVQGAILENLGRQIRWIPAAEVYQEVIATTDALLRGKPDLVKRFLSAAAKGAKYTVENQDEAVNILLKYHPQLGGTPEAKRLAAVQVKSWSTLVRSPETDRHGYGYGVPDKITQTLNFYGEISGIRGISIPNVYAVPGH